MKVLYDIRSCPALWRASDDIRESVLHAPEMDEKNPVRKLCWSTTKEPRTVHIRFASSGQTDASGACQCRCVFNVIGHKHMMQD